MADETNNGGQLVCREEAACYIYSMTEGTKDILRRVEHWPQEDQDELADLAREIEARRTGVLRIERRRESGARRGETQPRGVRRRGGGPLETSRHRMKVHYRSRAVTDLDEIHRYLNSSIPHQTQSARGPQRRRCDHRCHFPDCRVSTERGPHHGSGYSRQDRPEISV